jgi:hypothetical protein
MSSGITSNCKKAPVDETSTKRSLSCPVSHPSGGQERTMKCSSEMALTRASTKAWADAAKGGGRGGRIMSSTRWPGERGGIWGVGGVTTTEAAVRLLPSVLLVLVLVLVLWLLL